MKKTTIFAAVAGVTFACVGMMFAQAPVVSIDRYRYRNLAAAQSYILSSLRCLPWHSSPRISRTKLSGAFWSPQVLFPRWLFMAHDGILKSHRGFSRLRLTKKMSWETSGRPITSIRKLTRPSFWMAFIVLSTTRRFWGV